MATPCCFVPLPGHQPHFKCQGLGKLGSYFRHGPVQCDRPGTEEREPIAKSSRDCETIRLPDHQFYGRQLDCRSGPHRFRSDRYTANEDGSDGVQNFWEWLVEGLHTFLEGIIGPRLVKRTFWFFATIFIFILSANWMGLIPGVGTIGWGHASPHGFVIDHPLFRGANADVNLTLAMALVFFACWLVWALQEIGPVGFLKELFAPKGNTSGPMKLIMVVVFFASGCLEIISILFRPVSLSFRLYGNTFAGENMLDTMSTLVPHLGWLLPIPFYFLELLVGLVQALVFMLLTAVFTLLICQHQEEPVATQG